MAEKGRVVGCAVCREFWRWLGERSNLENGTVVALYITGMAVGLWVMS